MKNAKVHGERLRSPFTDATTTSSSTEYQCCWGGGGAFNWDDEVASVDNLLTVHHVLCVHIWPKNTCIPDRRSPTVTTDGPIKTPLIKHHAQYSQSPNPTLMPQCNDGMGFKSLNLKRNTPIWFRLGWLWLVRQNIEVSALSLHVASLGVELCPPK